MAQTGSNWLGLVCVLCSVLCPKRSLFPVFSGPAAETGTSQSAAAERGPFVILGERATLLCDTRCEKGVRIKLI